MNAVGKYKTVWTVATLISHSKLLLKERTYKIESGLWRKILRSPTTITLLCTMLEEHNLSCISDPI